jgi:hypothetical protein
MYFHGGLGVHDLAEPSVPVFRERAPRGDLGARGGLLRFSATLTYSRCLISPMPLQRLDACQEKRSHITGLTMVKCSEETTETPADAGASSVRPEGLEPPTFRSVVTQTP